MNELGLTLVWVSLQVSVLSLVAAAVYLVVRRGSPKAGAAATFIGLVLVACVSLSVLSPWPRWSFEVNDAETTAGESGSPATLTSSERAEGLPKVAGTPTLLREKDDATTESITVTERATFFWEALQEQLRLQAVPQDKPSMSWSGWLAMLFLVGGVIAIGRLIAGLVVVAGHRKSGVAISDAKANELLDVLCAEFSCSRTVELRESKDIASAATIGWKKPLILLPPEWPSWSERERRSVLAHEIAHISQNDFLWWLFAQAGLLLHFYHPLVHWLASRLRLEQELAADALAAAHAGGTQPYLKSLAELALRQVDRPVAWPARAFLPAKGTLMRRVEMLRDKSIKRRVATPGRKVLIIATLLATAVLVSGFRRPERANAAAADDAFVQKETLRQKKRQAEKARRQKSANAEKANAEKADAKQASGFDLKYVPPVTSMMIGVRPSAMAGVEMFRPIVPMIEEAIDLGETGINLADYEQVLLLGIPERGQPMGQPVFALTTTKPVDFSGLIKANGGATESRTHKDVPYLVSVYGRNAFYRADDRTLIMGPENLIRHVIATTKSGVSVPLWKRQFKPVAGDHFCYVLDMTLIGTSIEKEMQQRRQNPIPSPLQMMAAFSPLWKDTRVIVAGAGFDSTSSLNVRVTCGNPADAKRVEETVRSLIPLSRNLLHEAKKNFQNIPEEAQGQVSALVAFSEDLLDGVEIQRDESVVIASVETKAASIPMLIGMTLPAVQQARAAARRMQSMNNIKQIMLAMHNYHGVNKEFPKPVMTGPDGKTKYSWRVALLPYLEQQPLYDAYRFNEPWDSKHNLTILKQIPPTYRHENADPASTNSSYFVLTGDGTALGNSDEAVRIRDIRDGTSNTAIVFEARRDIPWTKPVDIDYDAEAALPKFGGYSPEGFVIGLTDGAALFLSKDIDAKLLRAMISRNGGEEVDLQSRGR